MTSSKPTPSTLDDQPARQGAQMMRIKELIQRVAPSDLPVLILGETGTGKEVTAQDVHQQSRRRDRALLRVNCAALTETLLESELFGHERGAFTGAVVAKPGLLATADGGTVFLDEIGELPPTTQSKLLRVIETGTYYRVGGVDQQRIDVRFVCATNRDLAAEVRLGRFRADLYYRINGITVSLPPLRDRPDELLPLAHLFLRESCQRLGRAMIELTPDARRAMSAHAWPGNVRELRQVMERAALLATGGRISAHDLCLEPASGEVPVDDTTSDSSDERDELLRALDRCGWNQTAVARELGMSRNTLAARLDYHRIVRPRRASRPRSSPSEPPPPPGDALGERPGELP